MKKIEHYILPENTNKLYKEEAISSIGLTRDVADKVNEIVDIVNTLSTTDLEWKQTQEGIIRKGVLYMKDNLVNSLNDLMELLKRSGFIDDRIEYHCNVLKAQLNNLINKMPDGVEKVDVEVIDARVGANGVTYDNLGYAIREQCKEIVNRLRNICIGTSNVSPVVKIDTAKNTITVRGSIYFGFFTYYILSNELTLEIDSKHSNSTVMLLLHRDGTVSLSSTTTHPTDLVLAYIYFGANLSISKIFSHIGKLITIDGEVYEKDAIKTNAHTANIFKKVVCVGDSFTSGHIYDSEGVPHATNEDYAWPAFMEKLTGNKYVNCGKSGATALTWLTADRGLPKAQASGKSQAYIIGLMINDSYNSTLPVGTESDIGTDNETYYGCLSKIVRELNAISPKAKIFVCTCPNVDSRMVAYNEAVRVIVDAYKTNYNTHCLDLYKNIDMYRNTSLSSDLYMSHYSAVGYEQFAEILNVIMSEYINNHIEDFKDVAFIEYD
jgi:hypothetical protein